jgi:C-terminal processing protease CtpA/Prc
VTLPLTDGYAVRATVMLTQAPDGQTVHRVGIAPDVQADEAEDWVLRALDMLGE